MNEALGAVTAVTAGDPAASAAATRPPAAPAVEFGRWFEAEVQSVNTQLLASEKGLQELASGSAVSVHEVMMRAEEARLSFQVLVQVRNRVLEAYQEVMRMQG